MNEQATGNSDADLQDSQQVARRLSISVRTLWRMVKEGKFPKPIRWNRKLVRWKKTAVDEVLRNL